ncbi:MAG: hypothetical protein NZ901_04625 [Geminocystis sp.]|nr:hypothetical protein [Geminocystis sp.]MCS7147459.1 hypothetical protein [Geminocystis sp.]MDW8115152.1 hypothetical protein [Geminocystis sp.]
MSFGEKEPGNVYTGDGERIQAAGTEKSEICQEIRENRTGINTRKIGETIVFKKILAKGESVPG